MPKRIKQDKRPTDVNQLARYLVETSTEVANSAEGQLPSKAQISHLMAEMGRRGGKIGGKRRLETMTAEERIRIAKRAAKARWNKEE